MATAFRHEISGGFAGGRFDSAGQMGRRDAQFRCVIGHAAPLGRALGALGCSGGAFGPPLHTIFRILDLYSRACARVR